MRGLFVGLNFQVTDFATSLVCEVEKTGIANPNNPSNAITTPAITIPFISDSPAPLRRMSFVFARIRADH